jgi:ketosteroid isomerase-like protein
MQKQLGQIANSIIIAATLFLTPNIHANEVKMASERSKRINQVFNDLRVENMNILDTFYDDQINFQDPVHQLHGLEQIKNYYTGLYKHVEQIKFIFSNEIIQGNTHVVVWQMQLKSKRLEKGKVMTLDGNSVIEFSPTSNKVIYHRDYFDMGEFIYEKIPVLGSLIKIIKNKIGGAE